MTPDEYGDSFRAHFLEQYKLCVEMADRMSARRVLISNFYMSFLSSFLAFLSIVTNRGSHSDYQNILIVFASILGIMLCYLWNLNIASYKKLNASKFDVINEMEKQMPFPCYTKEWEILTQNKDRRDKYVQLTFVEKRVPFVFAFLYLGLLIYVGDVLHLNFGLN
jgi:hypothetical protein